MWWYMSIIPATQEVEVGGSLSKAGSGKSMRPYQNQAKARHWYLMPVILATPEAEIRRIMV
jgi:hypothetical protein